MIAQFEGGPLHQAEYDVNELPDWFWYAHTPTRPQVLSLTYDRLLDSGVWYHRYQMVSGVYRHTEEHQQVTTYSGDAWLHLPDRRKAHFTRIPHPEKAPE